MGCMVWGLGGRMLMVGGGVLGVGDWLVGVWCGKWVIICGM